MIVTVEGNIGSGKTSLLRLCEDLKFDAPHVVVYEQVQDWTKTAVDGGQSIFDLYYQDKKRYAYVFQTYVLMTRVDHLLQVLKDNPDKVVICERSLLTDLRVFASVLCDTGDLTDVEWMVYRKWHESVCAVFDTPIVSGQMYLRASPDTCHARIQKRHRQGEDQISKAYLTRLHDKHDSWLLGKDNTTPTVVLYGDKDILNDETEQAKTLFLIKTFVNSIL
jgi:deoxyguanosine kinase